MTTTRNGLDQPTVGGDNGTWGGRLNNNMIALVDEALDGNYTFTSTGGTIVLTSTAAVTNQARNRVITVSAALTSAVLLQIPAVQKFYFINNRATGSAVTIGTSGGNAITCAQGQVTTVICDGTTTFNAGQSSLDNISAPTAAYSFGGQQITNLAAATTDSGATTRAQVSALIANAVTPVGGGAVRVSASDTNAGFLDTKLTFSGNLTASTLNAASNEVRNVTLVETFGYAFNSYSGSLSAASGAYSFRLPYSSFTMTEGPFAYVTSGSTSGPVSLQLRTTSGNLLSTAITIDQGMAYSASASVQPVISTSTITGYREVFIDANLAGTGVTGGVVYIIGRRS